MKILEVEWCDFIVWTTKEMGIIRISFDEQFVEMMLPRLKSHFNNKRQQLMLDKQRKEEEHYRLMKED